MSMEINNEKLVIYVGGLDESVNEKTLHAAFIPFGEIKTIEIPLDHNTEMHKGFGFIEYEEYEDCLHSIENMNDAELCGRVLRVNFARPQRFKEGYHRPIWMEEDFHKKHSKLEEPDKREENIQTVNEVPKQNNDKRFFA